MDDKQELRLRRIANSFAGLHAFKLRLVLIIETHVLEKCNQVGFVVAIDGKVNIMSESLAPCKPAYSQTTNEARVNAELSAQFQELFKGLFEFAVNIHEQSIGENARTRNA